MQLNHFLLPSIVMIIRFKIDPIEKYRFCVLLKIISKFEKKDKNICVKKICKSVYTFLEAQH